MGPSGGVALPYECPPPTSIQSWIRPWLPYQNDRLVRPTVGLILFVSIASSSVHKYNVLVALYTWLWIFSCLTCHCRIGEFRQNGLLNETRLQGLGEGWERTLETSLLRSPVFGILHLALIIDDIIHPVGILRLIYVYQTSITFSRRKLDVKCLQGKSCITTGWLKYRLNVNPFYKRWCVAFIMRDTETQIELEILDDISY